MSQASRDLVDRKVKGAGRTVVWCYAPGLFNGISESADAMRKLTGINIVPATDETFIEPKSTLTASGTAWMKKLGEVPPKEAVGQNGRVCKLFAIQDPDTEALGTLTGSDAVTIGRKAMKDWTSIYLLSSVMPPELVRTLEKSAGVHIYNHANDALYANKSYISINGAKAGTRTITLPVESDVFDALTDEPLFENVKQFDSSLMLGETAIYRIARRPGKGTTGAQ
jgi:beta-galactosidase